MRRIVFAILFCFFAFQLQGLKPAIRLLDQFDQSLASTNQLKEVRQQFEDLTQFQIIEKRQENLSCKEIVDLREIYIQEPLIQRINLAWDYSQIKLDNDRVTMSSIKSTCLNESFLNWNLLEGKSSENFFFSRDNKYLVHHFFANNELPENERMIRFENLKQKHLDLRKDSESLWVGLFPLEYFTWIGIKHSNIMNILVFLFVWIILFWLHGSWKSGALFWTTVSLALVFVYGGMSFLNQKQSVLSICLFVMVTVASLEDFLFLCHHDKFGTSRWNESFDDLRWPSFLTSLTTAIGFGSLVFSNLEIIRWFGFWAATGALLEWYIVFEILPYLLRKMPSLNFTPYRREQSPFFQDLLKIKPKKWLTFPALAIFFASLVGPDFLLSQSPEKTFPVQHELRKSLDKVSRVLGWEGILELIYPADQYPHGVITFLQNSTQVQNVFDFNALKTDFLEEGWSSSLKNEIIKIVKTSNESKIFFSNDGSKERSFVFINDLEIGKINSLKNEVTKLCGTDCFLTGELVVFSEQSQEILKTLLESFFISLILVILILFTIGWGRGYRWQIVPILISSVWGPFAVLFVIQYFQVEVNFVTCIILSVLVGLTGDNAIMYFYADKDIKSGSQKVGFASLWVMITMVVVSLLFLFNYFDPPRNLGLLMALGFFLSYVGDYYLLRLWVDLKHSK